MILSVVFGNPSNTLHAQFCLYFCFYTQQMQTNKKKKAIQEVFFDNRQCYDHLVNAKWLLAWNWPKYILGCIWIFSDNCLMFGKLLGENTKSFRRIRSMFQWATINLIWSDRLPVIYLFYLDVNLSEFLNLHSSFFDYRLNEKR